MGKFENAYLSGIIDGEGCICILHPDLLSFVVKIDIGMTSKETIDFCSEILQSNGMPVFRNEKKIKSGKSFYTLRTSGGRMFNFLSQLKLVTKRKQIRKAFLILYFQSLRKHVYTRNPLYTDIGELMKKIWRVNYG